MGKGISSFYIKQSVWFAFFKYILLSQSITNKFDFNLFWPLINVSSSELSCKVLAITAISSFTADAVQSSHLQQKSIKNDEIDGLKKEFYVSTQRATSLYQQLKAVHKKISTFKDKNNQLEVPDSYSKKF